MSRHVAEDVSSRRLRWAGPVAALLLLAVALLVLRGELRAFRYHEVMRAMHAIRPAALSASVALTVLAYLILPGYDALSLAYLGKRLPVRRVALGSVVAYGLSQTLGFPLLTGGAVRYRFWSGWGLSTAEITQAATFVGATFTVGIVAVCGAALLLEPGATLAALHLRAPVARAAGVLLIGVVMAYLAWSVIGRGHPLRVRGWEFPVPAPELALAQVALAAADWAVAGAVLYVLLPSSAGIGFLPFLGVFVLAQFAGLVSHVPGGVGVFETVVVVLLRPHVRADQTVGVLLAYRAIYYLLPFSLSLLLLAAYEVRRRRERLSRGARTAATATAHAVSRWGPTVLPPALSVTTFIGGMILLFSGATPPVRGRIDVLTGVFPLGLIELSHFAASVAGAGLLVLAWAIRRRLDAAYGLTIAALAVGIGASLLKGLDWEEALLLTGVLAVVVPSRRAFYRKAALTGEPFTPGWIVAVVAVLGATVWLGFFSYKHVEYANDLWWRVAERGDAPRFLRATAGAAVLLLAVGLLRLLRHADVEPELPGAEEFERARALAARSTNTVANLALLGDKALLFSETGEGFLMYGVEGRSWVALGDPIGPERERAELAWRFREEADRHGGWAAFYEVGTANLPLYIDLGLTLLKLGEEARVRLDTFSLEGGERRGMRRTAREVAKRGATFEIAPTDAVPALLPELRAISDAWLGGKSTREKSFSLGRFDEAYLRYFPVALVRVGGRVVAFANLWLGAEQEEMSVDLMRYEPSGTPPGVMEYLFIELMLWGKREGYHWFSLGMAPLSGFEQRAMAPLWSRAGALLFRHGEHFYNFQGLRAYKEKFDPVWEPRYLASPGGLALPRILANVATLISGGLTGVLTK